MRQNKNIADLKSRYKKSNSPKKDNSLRENHPVIVYVKFTTGLKLALVPFIIFVVIGAIVIYNSDFTWNDTIMQIWLILGAVVGIIWAFFYIGNRYELDDIGFKEYESGDVSKLTGEEKISDPNSEKKSEKN